MRTAFWFLIAITVFLQGTAIALGQPAVVLPPDDAPWYVSITAKFLGQFPDINGWVIAIFMALSVILRAVADLLTFISEKTVGKKDDEWAKWFAGLADWAASILGWFGGGVPKVKKKNQ